MPNLEEFAHYEIDGLILLDTSILGATGKIKLSEERINPEDISLTKIEKSLRTIKTLENIQRKHKIRIIPEVYKEIERYLVLVNYLSQQIELANKIESETQFFLKDYSNNLYRLFRSLTKNKTPAFSNQSDIRRYGVFLKLTSYLSSQKENTDEFGSMLNTDNKIIAAGFTHAYREPVHILTNDIGLMEKIGKIYRRLNQEAHETEIIPEHSINCYST